MTARFQRRLLIDSAYNDESSAPPETLLDVIARYAGVGAVVAWDRDVAPHLSGLLATALHDGDDLNYGFERTVRVYFSFEYPLHIVAGAAYKHRHERWFWAEPVQKGLSATFRLFYAIRDFELAA